MPVEIGPLDGRKARRKRCDACVKRRVKCRDGMPCDTCKRTGRICTFTTTSSDVLIPVFVNKKGNPNIKSKVSRSLQKGGTTMCQPRSMGPKEHEFAFFYFFKYFLPMNTFGNDGTIDAELFLVARSSSTLRDAVQAVAVLHVNQQDQNSVAPHRKLEALQAYHRAVRAMQKLITSELFLDDLSALWTTFLLGLFELMRDSTGTNWLAHFLYGTCTILRLQRPSTLAQPGEYSLRKRKFFFATRIFEIARSLIYSEPTFLSTPEWVTAIAELRHREGLAECHPKEALFDILPMVAHLSIRAMQFCDSFEQFQGQAQSTLIQSLAKEGMWFQQSLLQWYTNADTWRRNSSVPLEVDADLLIGYTYYHAISIYLSGTYDYHSHWSWPGAPCTPMLPQSQIDWHVSEILRLSRELLASGVSGVLLFFPLRVAGARAMDKSAMDTILDLFQTTMQRGFVVAEALTVDLSALWANRDIVY